MKKLKYIFLSFIITLPALVNIFQETKNLVYLTQPQYQSPGLMQILSGTLLLFDRPRFFEKKFLEITTTEDNNVIRRELTLRTSSHNSYLIRRLTLIPEVLVNETHRLRFRNFLCEGQPISLKQLPIAKIRLIKKSLLDGSETQMEEFDCQN